MIRIPSRVVLMLAVACFAQARGQAQDKPKAGAVEPVVKVYRVIDLVVPAPNYPYEGTYLPAMRDKGSTNPLSTGMGGGMMVGGMGGMGGGGTGGGGGMFQVPDRLAQAAAGKAAGGVGAGGGAVATVPAGRAGAMSIDMEQLIDAIVNIVEPESWEELGGLGSIQEIGGALAIRQTPTIQSKVQEFLEALRRESGALSMVAVEARWLLLDNDQLSGLRGNPDAKQPMPTGQAIDPQALAALPPDAERYAGQITCFNGQTVHIVSGRLETVINGAIPVVGPGVGYQPVMLAPHLGAFLQITPSTLPDGDGVLVDLHSSITRWETPGKHATIGTSPTGTTIEVDRMNVTAQQFATSMRVPLDKPVLVGGMTFPGDGNGTQSGRPPAKPDAPGDRPSEPNGRRQGLYLVIEIHSTPA